jgi:hypothetical protein
VRRHRPGEFDTFLFADYSGAASASAQRRAIALWRLARGGRPRKLHGPFPAAFNAWAGKAIFHCRVRRLGRTYGVPTLSGWTGDPVRLAERAMPGAKPATRLGGTGAVAGQTLVGLVALHRLLEDARRLGVPVLAWPMDTLVDDGESHVGCEIYPSFCRPPHVRKADLTRALDLSDAPTAVRKAARLEGWILGAPPLTPAPSRS